MRLEWFIAKRWFQSRRGSFLSFITLFSILGITLGTAALIITLSVLDGFEKEIKEKIIGFTGHIQTRGFSNKILGHPAESIEKIKQNISGITSITPFLASEAMIRSKEFSEGVLLKGIESDQTGFFVRRYLTEGEYVSSDSLAGPQLVVGKKLVRLLNSKIGDKVVLFSLPPEGSVFQRPRVMQFTVTGIFESGMAEYDDLYAYTDLRDARKFFGVDGVSGYDISISDIGDAGEIAGRIDEVLGYPHHSRTVFDNYRNLFAWVELQRHFSPIILALIIIVATVNIIGTLLMFVLERTGSIGMLKTMGAGNRRIERMIMIQGSLIGIAGVFLGNILAFGICWIQLQFKLMDLPADVYYMTQVPVSLRWENFALVSGVSFMLCYLTSILPTRAIATLRPVDALRFG